MENLIEGSLPHDDQMERAVIGSLFLDPDNADTIINILKPDDFFNIKNKIIYETIIDMIEDGKAIDPYILREELQKKGKLDFIGGQGYIGIILNEGVVPAVAQDLAHRLKEKSIARRLIITSQSIISKAKEHRDINELIEEAETSIFKISEDRAVTHYYPLSDLIKEILNIINELSKKENVVTGLGTGFYDLDRLTTGFHPGDLVIIAARPAMGKTAFSLSMLYHMSIVEKIPGAFFSLEMSKEQIAMRLICHEAKVPLRKVRSGFLNAKEQEMITEAALSMAKAPLYIDDTATLSILDLRAKARRLKREKDIGVVVIDYLQLLSSHRRTDNRQQEVAEISRGLKALAKELNIPVIALAQLSRQAEMRSDKRPQLADLRESGSIEQDADTVMFIHRPEYYKKNPTPEEEGLAEIIIAKQRNGPTGVVNLAFIKEITKFENLAKGYYQDNENSGEPLVETNLELEENEIPFDINEEESADF